jgi:hypothetical protein
MKIILGRLIDIANYLDDNKLHKESNFVDSIMKKYAAMARMSNAQAASLLGIDFNLLSNPLNDDSKKELLKNIRTNYHNEAKKIHPDVAGTDDTAIIDLNAAKEILDAMVKNNAQGSTSEKSYQSESGHKTHYTEEEVFELNEYDLSNWERFGLTRDDVELGADVYGLTLHEIRNWKSTDYYYPDYIDSWIADVKNSSDKETSEYWNPGPEVNTEQYEDYQGSDEDEPDEEERVMDDSWKLQEDYADNRYYSRIGNKPVVMQIFEKLKKFGSNIKLMFDFEMKGGPKNKKLESSDQQIIWTLHPDKRDAIKDDRLKQMLTAKKTLEDYLSNPSEDPYDKPSHESGLLIGLLSLDTSDIDGLEWDQYFTELNKRATKELMDAAAQKYADHSYAEIKRNVNFRQIYLGSVGKYLQTLLLGYLQNIKSSFVESAKPEESIVLVLKYLKHNNQEGPVLEYLVNVQKKLTSELTNPKTKKFWRDGGFIENRVSGSEQQIQDSLSAISELIAIAS